MLNTCTLLRLTESEQAMIKIIKLRLRNLNENLSCMVSFPTLAVSEMCDYSALNSNIKGNLPPYKCKLIVCFFFLFSKKIQ